MNPEAINFLYGAFLMMFATLSGAAIAWIIIKAVRSGGNRRKGL